MYLMSPTATSVPVLSFIKSDDVDDDDDDDDDEDSTMRRNDGNRNEPASKNIWYNSFVAVESIAG